jgi:hypothetical protein
MQLPSGPNIGPFGEAQYGGNGPNDGYMAVPMAVPMAVRWRSDGGPQNALNCSHTHYVPVAVP